MNCNEYDGIEKKVAFWIKGKHCEIGVILPEKPTTEEDIIDLYRTIAEIAVRSEQRKKQQLKVSHNDSTT